MLDLNLIREKPDLVRTALKNRQMEATSVDDILRLDEKRRTLLTQVEAFKAERNVVSKEIGKTLAPGASAGVGSSLANGSSFNILTVNV